MTQRKQKAIAPEQWDFRSLSEDELYAAAEYEYHRELVSPAQARKARALLNEHDKAGHKKVFPIVYPTMDDLPHGLMKFAGAFPAAPRAWLNLPPKTRAKYIRKTGQRRKPGLFEGFSLFPDPVFWDPENPPERLLQIVQDNRLRSDGMGIYTHTAIKINWAQPDKQIIKDFSSWLKLSRHIKPVVIKGKKAVPNDIPRLKWLGAYRLDACGMKYKVADTHIKRHFGQKRNDPHDILPDFQTHSGWQTAIDKADKLLRQIASRSF
jgi:hypothetical protein